MSFHNRLLLNRAALAGLHAEGKTSVTEPAQTRDHTERALAAFGFEVAATGNTISVAGGQGAIGHKLEQA